MRCEKVAQQAGPTNPPRFPNELISPIAAAAAGPSMIKQHLMTEALREVLEGASCARMMGLTQIFRRLMASGNARMRRPRINSFCDRQARRTVADILGALREAVCEKSALGGSGRRPRI
jgi:hypothetical protein